MEAYLVGNPLFGVENMREWSFNHWCVKIEGTRLEIGLMEAAPYAA